MVADTKVQMRADMEVDKVADKVADLSADKEKKLVDMKLEMVAYMELTKVAHKVADKKMADMELDIAADMFKTKCVGLKLFDAKCTRLAWLLRFAILFSSYQLFFPSAQSARIPG